MPYRYQEQFVTNTSRGLPISNLLVSAYRIFCDAQLANSTISGINCKSQAWHGRVGSKLGGACNYHASHCSLTLSDCDRRSLRYRLRSIDTQPKGFSGAGRGHFLRWKMPMIRQLVAILIRSGVLRPDIILVAKIYRVHICMYDSVDCCPERLKMHASRRSMRSPQSMLSTNGHNRISAISTHLSKSRALLSPVPSRTPNCADSCPDNRQVSFLSLHC